jgi:hypothetical protein
MLLTAVALQSLPDAVLDYFHTHEHAHDCHPDGNPLAHLEKEHIHCKNPQLFFRDLELTPAVFRVVLQGHVLVYGDAVTLTAPKAVYGGHGRAPPVRG